ncbi:MAG: DUF935 family protein [Verrucomicrobiaceae bacterium]|nr:DUF935 family protein [Verrucomicrobiaceae bacterium]
MKEIITKLNFVDRVKAFLFGKVPTNSRMPATTSPLAENAFIASEMTVDKIHSILRSAENGDCSQLFDLYRDIIAADSHIQGEFQKRKIEVLMELVSAQPASKENPADVKNANIVQEMLDSIPDKIRVFSHLLDSCLYPVSLVEKVFKPSHKNGLKFEIKKLVPVPHRLLDFRNGKLSIFDTDETGRVLTTSTEVETNRYIVHRGHILSNPDNWGGPMRALLFWWLFSVMDIGWWSTFLERYGTPFLVGKYDRNDDKSRFVLQRAFAAVQRLGGLVITKETQVEVQNALSSQNGDAFEKFLAICQREKSKLILGQTLSADAQPTGLNSGNSELHNDVRHSIKYFDCQMLATTLRDCLVVPFMRFNDIEGAVPKIVVGSEDEDDLQGLSTVLQSLYASGIRLTDESIVILGQRLGLTLERNSTQMPAMFSAKNPTENKPKDGIDAVWQIAGNTVAKIEQEYGNSLSVIENILEQSKSPEEFEENIAKFCASWPPEKVTYLIQDALTSNIINGATPRK